MSEIVSFMGNTPNTEAVPDIVETLESLLERAKSGEIQAFAYAVARRRGDGLSNGWDGNGGTRDDLAAAIAHLNYRYFSSAYDEASPHDL